MAKIALGAGVAVAATTGAGAVGVLPGGSQVVFDRVVSTIMPTSNLDESTDSGSNVVAPESTPTNTNHPDNFGGLVSDRAHDPNKVGATFGQETSEAAHAKSNDSKANDPADDQGTEAADDTGSDSTEDSNDSEANDHADDQGTEAADDTGSDSTEDSTESDGASGKH